MDNLDQRVEDTDIELINCPWKYCKSLGQYIRCYINLYLLCPKYITHKNNLKIIRDMNVH